jgi:hypothetical protein
MASVGGCDSLSQLPARWLSLSGKMASRIVDGSCTFLMLRLLRFSNSQKTPANPRQIGNETFPIKSCRLQELDFRHSEDAGKEWHRSRRVSAGIKILYELVCLDLCRLQDLRHPGCFEVCVNCAKTVHGSQATVQILCCIFLLLCRGSRRRW